MNGQRVFLVGCGKSLAAKAAAGIYGVPLLRLDFGVLYPKYYGEWAADRTVLCDWSECSSAASLRQRATAFRLAQTGVGK